MPSLVRSSGVHDSFVGGQRVTFLAGVSTMFIAGAASTGSALAQSEEIEPRAVGGRGATFVGVSGFVDRFSSSEAALPLNYIAQVDVCRFITNEFAVRVGAVGSGSSAARCRGAAGGTGAPALHAAGGLLYYFTPRSMISFYVGGEYWAQIRSEPSAIRGSVLGTAGFTPRSRRARASSFKAASAPAGRGDDDELQTRFVAQMGLRFKL